MQVAVVRAMSRPTTAVSLALLLLVSGCGVASKLLTRQSSQPVARGSASSPGSASGAFEKRTDEGMTTPTHAAYVGQIVFSSRPIDRDNPDEAALVSEFYGDEVIYGRAYLPHSFENEPIYSEGSDRPRRMASGEYVVKMFVDGQAHDLLERRDVRADRRHHTTVQVWPRPSPDKEKASDTWVDAINALTPGRHEVRLELWAREGGFVARAPLATGTLIVHKTADMRLGVGKTARELTAGMTDTNVASELLTAVRSFARAKQWKESIPDLTIHSPQWDLVILNPRTQHVSARRLFAWVHLEDGARCSAQYIQFEQKMHGTITRGPVYVKQLGPRQTLDCAPAALATDRWEGRTRLRPRATHEPAPAAAPRIAVTEPQQRERPAPPRNAPPPLAVTARESPPGTEPSSPGRVSLGVGMAANALDATGVASYGNIGLHLGRLEVGAGATWPLNAFGYARVHMRLGRLEVAPMLTATALAEMESATTFAIAGGLSVAYVLVDGRVRIGLRLDALASYNPSPGELALPVLGSTFARF